MSFIKSKDKQKFRWPIKEKKGSVDEGSDDNLHSMFHGIYSFHHYLKESVVVPS